MTIKRFLQASVYSSIVVFVFHLFNDMTRVEHAMMALLTTLFIDRFAFVEKKEEQK